jgi:hypothetical protein
MVKNPVFRDFVHAQNVQRQSFDGRSTRLSSRRSQPNAAQTRTSEANVEDNLTSSVIKSALKNILVFQGAATRRSRKA